MIRKPPKVKTTVIIANITNIKIGMPQEIAIVAITTAKNGWLLRKTLISLIKS